MERARAGEPCSRRHQPRGHPHSLPGPLRGRRDSSAAPPATRGPRRRRRKQTASMKYMRSNLHEVHGAEVLFRTWLDTHRRPCKLFLSEFVTGPKHEASSSTSGVAIPISWFTQAQLERLRPDQLPDFEHASLVPGRIQQLVVSNANT
eukprot:3945919-Pyramimonas_sp.AAC.1